MVARTPRPDGAEGLEDWIRDVAAALPRDQFTVPAERARDFLLMYGPCMQASRFASSYVVLTHAGYPNEATALARAAFEHAVTAHWAYFTKGGIDRFAVDMHREFGKYVDALADFLSNAELRSVLEGRPVAEGKGMPTFTDRMRELDHNAFLRTTYKTLSLALHPGHAAVLGYLAGSEGVTELREAPDSEYNSHHALQAAAMAAMLAKSLLEYIVDPEKALSLVNEASDELQLPPFLHDALPDHRLRFPRDWPPPPVAS